MKITLYIILFSFSFLTFAQDSIRISGNFKNNSKFSTVTLNQFGIKNNTLKTVPILDDKFTIFLSKNEKSGIYRLEFSQNPYEYFDVIINNQDKIIEFTYDVNQPKNPVFNFSEANKIWYSYKKDSDEDLNKIALIENLLAFYPNTTSNVYTKNLEFYKLEKNQYFKKRTAFIKENSKTLQAEMIENQPIVFSNPRDEYETKLTYNKNHFWDNINTSNPNLLNTPLYTGLIQQFIQLYSNSGTKISEQEAIKGFKESIDVIMQKFSGNSQIQEFAFKYLSNGFKEIGNEELLQYVDLNYQKVAHQCLDDSEKKDFNKRLEGYNALKIGNNAPNISFTQNGINQDLNNLQAEQTLVVFWASWCPHCRTEIPEVENWAKKNPKTKVLAISLDHDKAAYEEVKKEFPSFIHYSDFQGWKGKAVNDYYVYGTPSYILLDKDKKIKGRFTSLNLLLSNL